MGLVVCGFAIFALVDVQKLTDLVEAVDQNNSFPVFKTAAAILIIVCIFVIIVTFFGCCGALKVIKIYLFQRKAKISQNSLAPIQFQFDRIAWLGKLILLKIIVNIENHGAISDNHKDDRFKSAIKRTF